MELTRNIKFSNLRATSPEKIHIIFKLEARVPKKDVNVQQITNAREGECMYVCIYVCVYIYTVF